MSLVLIALLPLWTAVQILEIKAAARARAVAAAEAAAARQPPITAVLASTPASTAVGSSPHPFQQQQQQPQQPQQPQQQQPQQPQPPPQRPAAKLFIGAPLLTAEERRKVVQLEREEEREEERRESLGSDRLGNRCVCRGGI